MDNSINSFNWFQTQCRSRESILCREIVSTRQKIKEVLSPTSTTWGIALWAPHLRAQSHEPCGSWPIPNRAASTHAPGSACGAPHVQLLNSGAQLWNLLVHHRSSQKGFLLVPMHSICVWHPDISCWNKSRQPECSLWQESSAQSHAKVGQSCNRHKM